jgi:hypothetical protein
VPSFFRTKRVGTLFKRLPFGRFLEPVVLSRRSVWLALGMALATIGCSDKIITLSYTPPPPATGAFTKLTVFRFADQRGNEGDHGDPLRVGGIYGGYGNRLAKVVVTQPWPPRLLSALVAEFRAQGVDAAGVDQLPIAAPANAWLEGDLRNFSTESRWGRRAHISAVVRLRAPGGDTLVQKEIKADASGYNLNNFDAEILQDLLNEAFARFVRNIATDPDIRAGIQRTRSREESSSPSSSTRQMAPQSTNRPTVAEQASGLLGRWETVGGKSGIVDGVTQIEIVQEGQQVRWRMVRNGWMAGVLTNQEASGFVTQISESAIELSGKYDLSNPLNVGGQAVRQSFIHDGDLLRGSEVSRDGTLWPLVLRMVK